MLRVEGVDAYYGLSHVLQGVSLTVEAGEAVALLGRNGAGKTTTLKTIMAVVRARRGRITWNDTDITGLAPYRMAGKSTTSRIERRPVSTITSRSIPMPIPPVGGIPYSSAWM